MHRLQPDHLCQSRSSREGLSSGICRHHCRPLLAPSHPILTLNFSMHCVPGCLHDLVLDRFRISVSHNSGMHCLICTEYQFCARTCAQSFTTFTLPSVTVESITGRCVFRPVMSLSPPSSLFLAQIIVSSAQLGSHNVTIALEFQAVSILRKPLPSFFFLFFFCIVTAP